MSPTPDEVETAVWFAWGSAVAFLVGYSLRARWWRWLEGRALAVHGVAFLLLTTPFVVRYASGLSLADVGFAWYYIGSFVVAGLIEWWRLWVVWHRPRD